MGFRKTRRTYIVVAVGLIFLIATQYTNYDKKNGRLPRDLSSVDKQQIIHRTKSYSSPGSIAAVINTAKMGTGGLTSSFHRSWECESTPKVNDVIPGLCEENRIMIRTHFFENGSDYIQQHRRVHPEGQCLIATALRNPTDWFGSMYLQWTKKDWKPTEEMLRDYEEFLAKDDFNMLQKALPGLLKEFNIDSLIDQAKIMEENGGYSLIPAPISSVLAGCDLLFLRMEQSDQWPDIFQMLDPELKNTVGESRVDQHPENVDQINAIASYELSSEEKLNIYNSRGKFIQDWFDAYGYMDTIYEQRDVVAVSLPQ